MVNQCFSKSVMHVMRVQGRVMQMGKTVRNPPRQKTVSSVDLAGRKHSLLLLFLLHNFERLGLFGIFKEYIRDIVDKEFTLNL